MSNYRPKTIGNVLIVGGRSCQSLTESICRTLGKTQCDVTINDFLNTEINVKINETVRGKDIVIIQTAAAFEGRSVNDHYMELRLLLDALYLSSANSLRVVVPLMFYERSDKRIGGRTPIACRMIMEDISKRAERIITFDLHASQETAFSNGPCDNLYVNKIFADYIQQNLLDGMSIEEANSKFILVSPDAGAVKRVDTISEHLKLKRTIVVKDRDYTTINVVSRSTLTGDPGCVMNKTVIIVDDLVDSFGTMISCVNELKTHGAKNAIVMAPHGVLSGSALERINNCPDIIQVVVTNTVPQNENIKKCPKLVVIDIGPFLAEVIRRSFTTESISELFEN